MTISAKDVADFNNAFFGRTSFEPALLSNKTNIDRHADCVLELFQDARLTVKDAVAVADEVSRRMHSIEVALVMPAREHVLSAPFVVT